MLCLFTRDQCCSLQQETQPEWSESEEVDPGDPLTEKPSLSHFEKLPGLGFVYS